MKRNLLIFGLVLSITINIGVFGSIGYQWLKSRGEKSHLGETAHSPMTAFCERLGLSEEQIIKMEPLRETLNSRIEEIKTELREERIQFLIYLKEPVPDQEKITAELSKIVSLQTELQKIAVDQMLQEKKILTPEQQEIFFSIISKRLCPEGRHQDSTFLPLIEKHRGLCD